MEIKNSDLSQEPNISLVSQCLEDRYTSNSRVLSFHDSRLCESDLLLVQINVESPALTECTATQDASNRGTTKVQKKYPSNIALKKKTRVHLNPLASAKQGKVEVNNDIDPWCRQRSHAEPLKSRRERWRVTARQLRHFMTASLIIALGAIRVQTPFLD